MSEAAKAEVEQFIKGLVKRNPGEPEFHQAVEEVVNVLIPPEKQLGLRRLEVTDPQEGVVQL